MKRQIHRLYSTFHMDRWSFSRFRRRDDGSFSGFLVYSIWNITIVGPKINLLILRFISLGLARNLSSMTVLLSMQNLSSSLNMSSRIISCSLFPPWSLGILITFIIQILLLRKMSQRLLRLPILLLCRLLIITLLFIFSFVTIFTCLTAGCQRSRLKLLINFWTAFS